MKILILFSCGCLILGGIACGFAAPTGSPGGNPDLDTHITPTPTAALAEASVAPPTRTPGGKIENDPAGAYENFAHLQSVAIESRDLFVISQKYLNTSLESNAPAASPREYAIGEKLTFTIHNDDDEEHYKSTATLAAESPHAYFWVQDGLEIAPDVVNQIVTQFEEEIYPTNIAYFGSEWSPGIDGDAHVYILYTRNLGTFVGGYFSADDESPQQINEFSNMHEMIYINADAVSIDEPFIYTILAHEHQHMIQFYKDKSEETWITEGAAEFAAYINGYYQPWYAYAYLLEPDIPLTEWNEDMSETDPFYAGGFLFSVYFADRLGADIMQQLTNSRETGLQGVQEALRKSENEEYQNERVEDFYGDWLIANLINDPTLQNGRYSYSAFKIPGTLNFDSEINRCPFSLPSQKVHQYGADYLLLTCAGSYRLRFSGQKSVPLLSESAHSGEYAMWSNRGNESSMTMTKELDLTPVGEKNITMTYWTWYDIEEEYDYVYALVTTDFQDWDVLNPTDCVSGRYSFGCGITGDSGRWVKGELDLTPYAGQKIYLQFEYLTDLAVNGEGFLLDDIQIDELNYFEDFENGNGGWSEDGFVRVNNALPQTFQLALITLGDTTTVDRYAYGPGDELEVPLHLESGQSAVLVICATTGFTKHQAEYSVLVAE